MTFPRPTLDLLAHTREVEIETRSPKGAVHSVPIWVVVDGDDVFIRTYRGANSRWYRELLAAPGALVAGKTRIPVRAISATDAESVRRASAGYRAKYSKSGSLGSMLRPNVIRTTVRLEPATR
jgi:hypothetical protein